MSKLLLAASAAVAAAYAPTRMRVEYVSGADALAIDEPQPRFSWALSDSSRGSNQSAYQILVAPTTIGPVTPIWNSGTVASSNTLNVEYNGSTPLNSDSDYTWFVLSFDGNGNPSGNPASQQFSTGILNPADWQGAQWVAPAPGNGLLRATINLSAAVTRARLYISGLGYYKAWINGVPSDDHVLGSFTTFQRTVQYDASDVTAMLQPGCNTIAVSLGNGWWSQPSIKAGDPQMLMLLSVKDVNGNRYYYTSTANASALRAAAGTGVAAGATVVPTPFTSGPSPVVYNDIYQGETYDSRLAQAGWTSCSFSNASAWAPAVAPTVSPATYNATMVSRKVPIRIDRDYSPVAITQPGPGQFVFDFGQNMAGFITLTVPPCAAGTVITMQHAEILYPNGSAHNHYAPSVKMLGTYICAGTGDYETYTTQFVYYGFRYVQIAGFPGVPGEAVLTAHFIHTDSPQAGEFSSSSPMLNAVQHATRFAAMSNQMDVPTDCPQRERRGWLGDAQLSWETVVHNQDAAAFYTKWLRDIRDSQIFDADGNAVPDCAPFYGHGHTDSDPGWGIAYFAIVHWMTDYYSDDRIVERHYVGTRAYIESWLSNHYNATTGLMNFCLWGDWCPYNSGCFMCVPEYGSFFLVTALDIMASFATRLGNSADAARYSGLSTSVRSAYQAAYYNAADSWYGDGSAVSQMFALTLGIPQAGSAQEAGAVSRLLSQINNASDHNVGGIISTKLLFPLLEKYGFTNVSTAIQLQTSEPSYGYWINQGATTLWEGWSMTATSGGPSYNHIMFGGQGVRYFTTLAGIQRVPGSRSWNNLRIAPPAASDVPGLEYAAASIDTPIGLVGSQWAAATGYYGQPGSCAAVAEHQSATFTCLGPDGNVGPGTFTSVGFASFGTPTGSCGGGDFAVNPACNSNNSASVVAAACVGKSQCSVLAEVSTFGTDPCYDVVKALSVFLEGDCTVTAYTLTATIPVNAVSTVVVPTAPATAASATVFESGVAVWKSGAFIPGAVQGITGATTANGGAQVVFTVGSGVYTFSVVA